MRLPGLGNVAILSSVSKLNVHVEFTCPNERCMFGVH